MPHETRYLKGRIYSADQVAQHGELMRDMQHSNSLASHLVLRLGRKPLQGHVFKSLCKELRSLARSMTLQIFLCEQIADSGLHKHYDRIDVTLGTTCDFCLENGQAQRPQNHDAGSLKLMPNQACALQLHHLSRLITTVAHGVSHASLPMASNAEHLLCSLAALSQALSRQRRHMELISVRQPTEIKIEFDLRDVCPDC